MDPAGSKKYQEPNGSQPHLDNRYIQGIIYHNHELLQEIYKKFLPRIINFIRSNGGSHHEALDIFQDGIMIIYKKATAEELEIKRSFYNYLYTICKNLWMREVEKKKGVTPLLVDTSSTNYNNETIIPDIDHQIREQELYKLYMKKFMALGKDCQQVLKSFFEGTDMKTIARKMGYASEGYAKKRKHLCQKKLIEAIRKDPDYRGLL